MIAITPGVQNLHRNLAAFIVHGICHLPMLRSFAPGSKLPRERFYPTRPVRRVTTRDNQTDIAPGALGKVGRKTVVFIAVFKSSVHGAHQHPVFQCCEAEIERGEEVWVLAVSHR